MAIGLVKNRFEFRILSSVWPCPILCCRQALHDMQHMLEKGAYSGMKIVSKPCHISYLECHEILCCHVQIKWSEEKSKIVVIPFIHHAKLS